MSKSFIKSGLAVLAVLALASCAKTEDLYRNPDSVLQIESVSGISMFALMQEPASKAVITSERLPGDEAAKGIGLFVTAQGGGAYDGHDTGYTNVKYTCDGSKWSTQSPIYLSGNDGKLYGYFPYNADATDLRAIPVESSLNGTDYLYAEPQDVSFGKPATIQMNHALSRLHLTIKKGANFTAGATLSKITLKSTAIDAAGTVDLTTGAVTPSKKSGETGTVKLTTDGTITDEGIVKDILLVPSGSNEGKKDIEISLMINGTPAVAILSGKNSLDIRQGIQNNVTLTIDKTGIEVTDIDGRKWDDQGLLQIPVGSCTVTVKLAEEQLPELADDIVFIVTPHKNEDGKVIVEALSKSQKRLGCYLSGGASCNVGTGSPIGSFSSHIFTISNVTVNTTATIGYPRPESINLQVSSLTAYVGCPFKLKETVLPNDTYNKKFAWSSSNPSVATVDENGRVTPIAAGKADITATTEVGGLVATCKATVEDPALSGVFSVGPAENCKQVRFSQGNLRYTPNIESWWFFNKQYEYGHSQDELSLFTWGYGSWSTNWETDFYKSNEFSDWGTQIGDGITWRTLTKDEWTYLLTKRTNAVDKVGYATVCGMCGIILLPDEFEDPKTNESTSPSCVDMKFVPKSSNGWELNIYTSGNSWNKMESGGAVFLPAAGNRSGSKISDVGKKVDYWSSSVYDPLRAYNIENNSDVTVSSVYRNNAYSVRLVTDVK